MFKRVSQNKKENQSNKDRKKDSTLLDGTCYSADDNFHTYVNNKKELFYNSNFHTLANKNHNNNNNNNNNTNNKMKCKKSSSVAVDNNKQEDEVMFKKFFKVFSNNESNNSSSNRNDWVTNSANNLAPKILAKRFCGKKTDKNELHRSNSFKFERFDKKDEETEPSIFKQISLCDDYSLPVDFVNKRPLSLDSGTIWNNSSPSIDQVQNVYCSPQNAGLEKVRSHISDDEQELYNCPEKDCPRSDSSDKEREEDDNNIGTYQSVNRKSALNSKRPCTKTNTYTEVRKSPYYYSELLKKKENDKQVTLSKDKKERKIQAEEKSNNLLEKEEELKEKLEEEEEEEEDMATKQRHIYETAFDSKICSSNEMLDLDVVTNHVLEKCSPRTPSSSISDIKDKTSSINRIISSDKSDSSITDNVTERLSDLEINISTAACGYSRMKKPMNVLERRNIDKEEDKRQFMNKHQRERKKSPIIISKCYKKRCKSCCKYCKTGKDNIDKYPSTESMTSSEGSLESVRSSTSEGNISTTSTDSHRSSSLSSHSSDSTKSKHNNNNNNNKYLSNRFFHQNKLHILSPISDKSFQENNSELCEKNQQDEKIGEGGGGGNMDETNKMKITNKILNINLPTREFHHGSDSGISIESRTEVKHNNDLMNELPFDMPKLRRKQVQLSQNSFQDTSSSGIDSNVDLKDLPFDMPKLRRKLVTSTSTEDCVSDSQHADENMEDGPSAKPQLTLNLQQGSKRKSLGLSLNLNELNPRYAVDVDVDIPLERQGWYHGAITRLDAENELRNHVEGSYLVRNSESGRHDYSLSLKSAKGFMHMRIQKCPELNKFILGQFSSPFNTIPTMIRHYSSNQLPIRGAEHMCLLYPVIARLL